MAEMKSQMFVLLLVLCSSQILLVQMIHVEDEIQEKWLDEKTKLLVKHSKVAEKNIIVDTSDHEIENTIDSFLEKIRGWEQLPTKEELFNHVLDNGIIINNEYSEKPNKETIFTESFLQQSNETALDETITENNTLPNNQTAEFLLWKNNKTISLNNTSLDASSFEIDNRTDTLKIQTNSTRKSKRNQKLSPMKPLKTHNYSDMKRDKRPDENIYQRFEKVFENVNSNLEMLNNKSPTETGFKKAETQKQKQQLPNKNKLTSKRKVKAYEKMKEIMEDLSQKFSLGKNSTSDITSLTFSSDLINENDNNVLSLIKMGFQRCIDELSKLDAINNHHYLTNSYSFLSPDGSARISRNNLATIIRRAYDIYTNQSINEEKKISTLISFISSILFTQHQGLVANNFHPKDSEEIVPQDILEIAEKSILKTEFNQYEINGLEPNNKPKVMQFINAVLKQLPVRLLDKDLSFVSSYEQKPEEFDKDTMDEMIKKENEIFKYNVNMKINTPDENIFITSNHKNWKMRVLGPAIRDKMEKQLSPTPGQGRKSVARDGTIDSTDIFDTHSWPSNCKTGNFLSPININHPYVPEEMKLRILLEAPNGTIRLYNDNFKLILSAQNFGSIYHGNHEYSAKEIHIHVPSEHTFGDDEVHSPMELQIVCQDLFGNSAVVSVLLNISNDNKDNQFLYVFGFGMDNPLITDKLRNNEPIDITSDANRKQLDLGVYLNSIEHYVSYIGSFTSPPCSSNIQWFVLLEKLTLSQKQLDDFPMVFGRQSNVRGLQPLNNRSLRII